MGLVELLQKFLVGKLCRVICVVEVGLSVQGTSNFALVDSDKGVGAMGMFMICVGQQGRVWLASIVVMVIMASSSIPMEESCSHSTKELIFCWVLVDQVHSRIVSETRISCSA